MPETFLSDAWIDEVQRIRDSVQGLMMPPGLSELRVNLVVTDGPADDGHYNLTGAPGGIAIRRDERSDAMATVSMPYDLAKAMFVDQNPQAVMQGYTSGQMKVDGDLTKLMGLAQALAATDPPRVEFDDAVRAMTS